MGKGQCFIQYICTSGYSVLGTGNTEVSKTGNISGLGNLCLAGDADKQVTTRLRKHGG